MKKSLIILLCVLVIAAAAAGYAAGPFIARAHPRVQLAERIALEQREHLTTRTESSQAYRETGDPISALYAEAREIEQSMSFGAAIFGAWCGIVIALKAAFAARDRGNTKYEIDPAHCVACARCFPSCPHEHEERNQQTNLTGSSPTAKNESA